MNIEKTTSSPEQASTGLFSTIKSNAVKELKEAVGLASPKASPEKEKLIADITTELTKLFSTSNLWLISLAIGENKSDFVRKGITKESYMGTMIFGGAVDNISTLADTTKKQLNNVPTLTPDQLKTLLADIKIANGGDVIASKKELSSESAPSREAQVISGSLTTVEITDLANEFTPENIDVKNTSVKVEDLHDRIKAAFVFLNKQFPGLVISSWHDGDHSDGSAHYCNCAVDIGKWSSNPQEFKKLEKYLKESDNATAFKNKFGIEDIFWPRNDRDHHDHIHIELLPKYRKEAKLAMKSSTWSDHLKQAA